MKLRTRMIWIHCLIFLSASLITEILIFYHIAENKNENACLKARQEAEELNAYLTEKMHAITDEKMDNPEIYLQYLLKQRNNDYDLCFRENAAFKDNHKEIQYTEVYNHTILTIRQLLSYHYRQTAPDHGETYATAKIKGSLYIIFRFYLSDQYGTFSFFHLTDVSYVEEELLQLLFTMLLVTLSVAVSSVILLELILKKALKPLQELSNSAKLIAEGEYGKRVPVVRKDEIGVLSENFNKMASEVKKRTGCLVEEEKKKSLFMGNLTHELKTPMTVISGYAQTLLTARLSEEEKQEALLYIDKECRRLERLSQKMLQLLAIDSAAGMSFKKRRFTAKQLFSDVKLICQPLLDDRSMELAVQEQGESFFTDIDLMTDVLVNLVENAVKASEAGQKIILRAGDGWIEVEDFGRGIPKEELGNILEPFYMIDKSRSRKSGGAGLGLALTALILEKLEVKLTIESEVGKGSRFILQFV